jgi:hypothetical protein
MIIPHPNSYATHPGCVGYAKGGLFGVGCGAVWSGGPLFGVSGNWATVTQVDSMSARDWAERKIEPILEWNESEQALLFHILVKAGWTRDRARTELMKKNWWVS